MRRRPRWERLIKATMKARFGFEGIAFTSIKAAQAVKAFAALRK